MLLIALHALSPGVLLMLNRPYTVQKQKHIYLARQGINSFRSGADRTDQAITRLINTQELLIIDDMLISQFDRLKNKFSTSNDSISKPWNYSSPYI